MAGAIRSATETGRGDQLSNKHVRETGMLLMCYFIQLLLGRHDTPWGACMHGDVMPTLQI